MVELAVVFSSSSWTSSSIGESEDSKEREFNREPPATVQFVEELHEVVELVFSESIVFRCVGDQCPQFRLSERRRFLGSELNRNLERFYGEFPIRTKYNSVFFSIKYIMVVSYTQPAIW